MADSAREQKLAAARKKLRQFQKKKGTKRTNSSKDGTPESDVNFYEDPIPSSEAGTLSSHASSVDLASEEFSDLAEDTGYRIDNHESGYSESLMNGEAAVPPAGTVPDGREPPVMQPHSGPVQLESTHGGTVSVAKTQENNQGTLNNVHCQQPTAPDECQNKADSIITTTISTSNMQIYGTNSIEIKQQSDPISHAMPQGTEIIDYDQGSNEEIQMESENPLHNNVSPLDGQLAHNITDNSVNQTVSEKVANQSAGENAMARMQYTTVLPEYSHSLPEGQDSPQLPQEVFEKEGSVSSETTASVTTAIHVVNGESRDREPILKSSSESLRQISLQLSGLMNESEGIGPGALNATISELERRNTELAAMLQQETENSQQQVQYSAHLKAQLEKVEAELAAAHGVLNSAAGGGPREVESLREQLQVHIQTIGILVAEKSELESKFTHSNQALRQKAEEVTELEGRLSASRQRVREMEAELTEVTTQRNTTSSLLDVRVKELEANKTTTVKTNKLCEELKNSVAELTERLSVKTQDYDKLFTHLTDTKSQLAMANLHIQQLRDSTGEEVQVQLEQVQAEHKETQRQLEAAQTALSQAHTDNSQLATQYQHYTTQLAANTQALQEQVAQLTTEKEQLVASLEETKLKLETAQQPSPTEREDPGQVAAERERLTRTITGLQEETLQLKEHNAALTNDNNQLSKLADQLSRNVEELEMQLERNKTEEVDTSQLLAAMQSDKVAAARALTQNKQLKEQLEELQSGFIIMSNKKLELTEKLEKELHVKKSLNQEIATLNEEITNMKEHAIEKDREITVLRENSESLGAQLMMSRSHSHQQEGDVSQIKQDLDHLTQENATLMEQIKELEDKLKLSKVEIEDLTRQNGQLHSLITEYGCTPTQQEALQESSTLTNGATQHDHPDEGNSESKKKLLGKVAILTASVSKLEAERSSLQLQLDSERAKYNKILGETLAKERLPHDVITTEPKATTAMGDTVPAEELQRLQEAHAALESRFNRSMKEVAELSDEKQRLDHVVEQLQLETESIGDYITIYQFQRGVMKQQARERELELSSLYHEREEMKVKLATLQELMCSLAQEKGTNHQQLEKITNVIKNPSPLVNGVDNDERGDSKEGQVAADTPHDTEDGKSKQPGENGSDIPSTEENAKVSTDTDAQQQQSEGLKSTQHTLNKTSTTDTAKSPTVQRILDLLNEMETTSQMEHCGLQKFHPCPLCSGKLITV